MMKNFVTIAFSTLAISQASVFAASGKDLLENMDTSPANPANKRIANFAGMYVAKALTVVKRVEKISGGHRAYVQVGGKECSVVVIDQNGELFANYLSCDK